MKTTLRRTHSEQLRCMKWAVEILIQLAVSLSAVALLIGAGVALITAKISILALPILIFLAVIIGGIPFIIFGLMIGAAPMALARLQKIPIVLRTYFSLIKHQIAYFCQLPHVTAGLAPCALIFPFATALIILTMQNTPHLLYSLTQSLLFFG
jgi:hypothetical protein